MKKSDKSGRDDLSQLQDGSVGISRRKFIATAASTAAGASVLGAVPTFAQEGTSSGPRSESYEYLVVGAGMVGAATAYYLSKSSSGVAVIGMEEPTDYSTHDGPFSSHYDASRFYRTLDPRRGWAVAAYRSFPRFPALEEESGIEFHKPTGNLRVYPPNKTGGEYFDFDLMDKAAAGLKVETRTYPNAKSLSEDFPYLSFPEGVQGHFETGETAGVLNPRKLIAAHLELAKRQGAELMQGQVVSFDSGKNGVDVTTADGRHIRARKVVLACGAWTNALLQRPLAVTLAALTVLMAEVTDADAERLDAQPCLIYSVPPKDPFLTLFYMIPAVEFPDGKQYLKFGLSAPMTIVANFDELNEFFQLGGSEIAANLYLETLKHVMPSVAPQSHFHKPCVVSVTPSHYPYIDEVEPNVYVAAFGNAAMAKSSDEFGRLTARLVETGNWDDGDILAEDMKATYL